MARVDFAFGAADRMRTACVVTRKRYMAGATVLAYSTDAQRLAAFDRLLWAFDPTSFVPHLSVDDPWAVDTPVVLSARTPGAWLDRLPESVARPWLLNLDDHCPPDVNRFERVMEIVANGAEDRQLARLRWREYAGAGHDVHAHDLRPTTRPTEGAA
jgi:DNA polymerase-3 subunit chi